MVPGTISPVGLTLEWDPAPETGQFGSYSVTSRDTGGLAQNDIGTTDRYVNKYVGMCAKYVIQQSKMDQLSQKFKIVFCFF